MLFSAQQLFSEAQNMTGTGTNASTNIIDLGATGTVVGGAAALTRDIGPGQPIAIRIQLTAAAAGTTPTLDVVLEVDDNTGFASATTVASAVQIAGGVAGTEASIEWIPKDTDERYLRVLYTLGGTAPDYTVTAGIVGADQTNVVPGA